MKNTTNTLIYVLTAAFLVWVWGKLGVPLLTASSFWWGFAGTVMLSSLGVWLLSLNSPIPVFPETVRELAWAYVGAVWLFCGFAMLMVYVDPGFLSNHKAQVLFGISLAEGPWVLCYMLCSIAYKLRHSIPLHRERVLR